MEEFEKNVQQALHNCGINLSNVSSDNYAIGAAVSGGADSVSLLVSLCVL